ncbi:hypothetical protein HYG77_04390 [Rhodococcus sp. ZPP]|uniref:hypothetical protein n=1 Tax=Rhodococcus sp. ZPP TaxID=2749906 RepID=UPI001AD86D02|nr:hypothetical protein [Rhodococcus sp. ZPP]QTJ64907.1 hypothetical protein HYG77_04390 [Rhodococcus sp. ZPP]
MTADPPARAVRRRFPFRAAATLLLAAFLMWISAAWYFGSLDYPLDDSNGAFVECGSPFSPTPRESLAVTPEGRQAVSEEELYRLCAAALDGTARISLVAAVFAVGVALLGARLLRNFVQGTN